MKKILFLSLFLVGCKGGLASRIYGPDTKPSQPKTSLISVSCCQDTVGSVSTYPSFLPQSQIDLCEFSQRFDDNYLAMHVDCGHGHHTLGDNFYPSHGY